MNQVLAKLICDTPNCQAFRDRVESAVAAANRPDLEVGIMVDTYQPDYTYPRTNHFALEWVSADGTTRYSAYEAEAPSFAYLKEVFMKAFKDGEPGGTGTDGGAFCGLDLGVVEVPFPAWACKLGSYAWLAAFLYYGNQAARKPNPFNVAITAVAGWNAGRAFGVFRRK